MNEEPTEEEILFRLIEDKAGDSIIESIGVMEMDLKINHLKAFYHAKRIYTN